jgi:hypothetical protein
LVCGALVVCACMPFGLTCSAISVYSHLHRRSVVRRSSKTQSRTIGISETETGPSKLGIPSYVKRGGELEKCHCKVAKRAHLLPGNDRILHAARLVNSTRQYSCCGKDLLLSRWALMQPQPTASEAVTPKQCLE